MLAVTFPDAERHRLGQHIFILLGKQEHTVCERLAYRVAEFRVLNLRPTSLVQRPTHCGITSRILDCYMLSVTSRRQCSTEMSGRIIELVFGKDASFALFHAVL